MPPVKYVNGATGIVFGIDYGGNDVIAYGSKIPNSNWYILTKINYDEINSSVRSLFIFILIIVLLLIIVVGFLISFLLHKQAERHRGEIIEIKESKKFLQNNYEHLLRFAKDMIFVYDYSGNIKFVNQSVISNYGYTEKEILDLKITEIIAESKFANVEEFKKKISEGNGLIFESLHKRKDGTVFPVEVSSQSIKIKDEIYVQSIVRDTTEWKKAEIQIKRLNRVYSVLSDVNQLIIRIKDKLVILKEACRIAVEEGGFTMVWIGFLNKEKNKIEIVSSAGYTNNYLEEINLYLNDEERAKGPSILCLKTGKEQICDDIENDPRMSPWKNIALKNNYRSSASFPIKIYGEVKGVINFYSNKIKFFNQEEIKLLIELANDISYAIEFLGNEEKRIEAEKELKKSEEKYRTIFQNSMVGIYRTTPDGKILMSNMALVKMLGYNSFEELAKRNLESKEYEPSYKRSKFIEIVERDGYVAGLEGEWNKADGGKVFVREYANAIRDNDGKTIYYDGIIEDVTDRKLARDELKKQTEQLISLNKLSEKINQTLFLDEVISLAIAELKNAIKADVVFLFLKEGEKLNLRGFDSTLSEELLGGLQNHVVGECLCGLAASLKKAIYSKDIFKDIRCTREECKIANLKSFAALPLFNQNEIIGVIGVSSKYERDFKKDASFLETLSKTISIGINNSNLFTQTKNAQEILKESEEKYRTLVEHNPDGIFVLDLNGKFLSINKAVVEITGYSENELLNMTFLEMVQETHKKNYFDKLEEINKGKISDLPEVYEIINKSGEKLFIEMRIVPFLKNNELIGLQGIARDVTEKQKVQEELLTLTRAISQSPVSVIITDKKGNIEYANPKALKLTGYSLDELKGENPRIFKSGKKTKEEYKILWDTILNGEEWNGEFYNKKKDGTFFWESALISPVKDKEGNITHFVAVKEDITDKKKILEELITAKEKAENANKTKDLFLANMSHELRTPLIGILGYSDLLLENLTQAEHVDMAKGILRSGKRLLNTLNLILDLTRIESDKFELSISDKDIYEELEFVYNVFKGTASEKKLEFTLKKLDDNLIAKVDPSLVTVIIENLVNNAIKFTKTGGISIVAGKDDDKNIYVKVIDTGIGIDEKHFSKIFEEFRQVSEGINREFQGTGLGLSITKRYVELLNGNISVESKVGVGTTFTVKFPSGRNSK